MARKAMRHTKRGGSSFLLCLLLNLFLNFEWSIPAWILLVLHFIFGLSLWYFYGGLALWLIATLVSTLIFSCIAGAEAPRPPQENKNPYSPKNELLFPNRQRQGQPEHPHDEAK